MVHVLHFRLHFRGLKKRIALGGTLLNFFRSFSPKFIKNNNIRSKYTVKRSKKGHRPHLFLEIGFEMSPERSKSLPRGFWKCSGSSTPESRKFRGCASQSHHFRFTPSPKTKPKPSQTHPKYFPNAIRKNKFQDSLRHA